MRALLATINYDHPQLGMLDAFQKIFGKENVADCDYWHPGGEHPDEMLVRMARDFQPDWVWLQVQTSKKITPQGISRLRQLLPNTIVTHWTGDLRPQVGEYLSSICCVTHATFCSSVGQIPMFQAAGAPHVRYVQIGLDWDEDVAAPVQAPPCPVPEVVMCGGHYGNAFPGTKDRVGGIRALVAAGLPVGVVGNGWPGGCNVVGSCHVKQQIHVWRAAKVCLNINHFNDVELYYSDRQLIAMASGKPVVCHYVPGLEREFANWEDCVWYRGETELVDVVRKLLASPEDCARIGANGKKKVLEHHTWEARIRRLVPFIEELRS